MVKSKVSNANEMSDVMVNGRLMRKVLRTRGIELFPRVSWKHVQEGTYTDTGVYVDEIVSCLTAFVPIGSEQFNQFLSKHAAVQRVTTSGEVRYEVVQSTLSGRVSTDDKRLVANAERRDRGSRCYTLNMVLNDRYTANKFGLSAAYIDELRKKSLVQPAQAAEEVEKVMRAVGVGHHVVVKVGSVPYTRATCVASIRALGRSIPSHEFVNVEVVGDKAFATEIPDGAKGLVVRAPLSYTEMAVIVYRMCTFSTPHQVSFLLSNELAKLSMGIIVDNRELTGDLACHAGVSKVWRSEHSQQALSTMTSEQRIALQMLGSGVRPVLNGSDVIASAIQFDQSHVAFNQHTQEMFPDARIEGVESISNTTDVSVDLVWKRSVREAPRHFVRQADVGEHVAVLYSNGDRAVLSDSASIVSNDGVLVRVGPTLGVHRGCSGGMLVALRDMALVGMYIGSRDGLCEARSLVNLHEILADAYVPEVKLDPHEEVMRRLRSTANVASVMQSLSGLVAVYKGEEHMGVAMKSQGRLLSTVPPGTYVCDGVEREFNETADLFTVAQAHGVAADVLATRTPNHCESVVVVGRDAQGLYNSSVTRVTTIAHTRKGFFVPTPESFACMTGALVFSLEDGALLGQYVRATVHRAEGRVSLCASVDGRVVKPMPVAADLSKLIKVDVGSWAGGRMSEALRHSSIANEQGLDSNARLALLGDSVLRYVLTLSGLFTGKTVKEISDDVSHRLSNAALAACAEKSGVSKLICSSVGIMNGSRANATLLEAIVGAVALESRDVYASVMALMSTLSV